MERGQVDVGYPEDHDRAERRLSLEERDAPASVAADEHAGMD